MDELTIPGLTTAELQSILVDPTGDEIRNHLHAYSGEAPDAAPDDLPPSLLSTDVSSYEQPW
jgi:hypothetical protein